MRALEWQAQLVSGVEVSQLALESPCSGWSVRAVMNHSIGVTRKFTDFASGATDEPRSPPGDLLGPDHAVAFQAAVAGARAAWAGADMTRRCHLPFGTFLADSAAGINLFDVLAHGWDIAVPTGVSLDCDDDLWIAGLDAARVVIGPTRDPRYYGAEIPSGPDAEAKAQFLAYLGRR